VDGVLRWLLDGDPPLIGRSCGIWPERWKTKESATSSKSATGMAMKLFRETQTRIAALFRIVFGPGEPNRPPRGWEKYGGAEWVPQADHSVREFVGVHCRGSAPSKSRGRVFRWEQR